ncbi:MAG: hypothetical protein HYX26_06930 [Acidobacteriales bacterium]|nr:hypothetical protein [Terriglobales bacterium]
MKRPWILVLTILAMLALPSVAQKRDPLNELESDQLREAYDDPEKRLKLMLTFVQKRILAVEGARTDASLKSDRGKVLHQRLDDFSALAESFEDNLDMFTRHRVDLRKVLVLVVPAYEDWVRRLQAFKDATSEDERRPYEFALQNAMETAQDGLETARELVVKHKQMAEESKKKK